MDACRLRGVFAEKSSAQSQILKDIKALGSRVARGSVTISALCILALCFFCLVHAVLSGEQWRKMFG